MGRACIAVAIILAACGRIGFDSTAEGGGEEYAAAVLADAPFAYYRLGEPLGASTFRDISRNERHAEVLSSAGGDVAPRAGAFPDDTDTATRMFGEGNRGTGGTGYGTFPEVWTLWSSDFTIEAFVDAVSTSPSGNNYAIVICETYQVDGFRVGWSDDLQVEVWSTEAAGTAAIVTSRALNAAWTHIAVVRRAGVIEVFFDGAPDGAQAFTYNVPTAGADCGFGSFHGMASDLILDELAIYDRALSDAQIAAHFAASGL